MGWGSKKSEKEGEPESKKLGFFARLHKDPKPTTPAPANPYAAAPQSNANPYATQHVTNDPYAPKSQSSLTQPPTSSLGSLTLNGEQAGPPDYARSAATTTRPEKSAVPPNGYGGGPPKYQPQGSYGQAGGYGSDPYGNGSARHGAAGYGGLGRSNSQDTVSTDVARGALFGNAAQRAHQQPQQQSSAPEPPSDSSYSNTGGYDSAEMPGGYGAGAERELTAEEQDEQDVQAAKSEIRDIKQRDVASTSNARRIAEQTEAIGRETLATLHGQSDRLASTESSLDMATNHNIRAAHQAKELKNLNRNLFTPPAPHNPFTKASRERQADQAAVDANRAARERREATALTTSGTKARQQAQQREINGNVAGQDKERSLAERAKWQFEADSEDEAMEDIIEDNLNAIERSVGVQKQLAIAQGDVLGDHIKRMKNISGKADHVDDELAKNQRRLAEIARRG